MKVFVASDLHCEFYKQSNFIDSLPNDDRDAIVVAGDLCSSHYLCDNLDKLCKKYKKVIYVNGNHDFYHSSYDKVMKEIHACESRNSNLYFLNNNSVDIDGVNFIGCTLWFEPLADNIYYELLLNDFNCIKDFKKFVYKENRKSLSFLKNNVKRDSVVITHHIPTVKGIDPRFQAEETNRFFVCPSAHDVIVNNKPRIWIYGHTHIPASYVVEETQLLCNPYGYPHEEFGFDDGLIIDI